MNWTWFIRKNVKSPTRAEAVLTLTQSRVLDEGDIGTIILVSKLHSTMRKRNADMRGGSCTVWDLVEAFWRRKSE